MSTLPEPSERERLLAKRPHDIFLSNLIGNHILIFTAISTFGPAYIKYLLLVPLLSFAALGYTYFRSGHIRREDSEFVWAHWQIARRWSKVFLIVLSVVTSVAILGWVGKTYLGMMKEMVYGMVGGLSLLPTLVSVLVLIVIESDSLHHARVGTLPGWALRRFLGIEPPPVED